MTNSIESFVQDTIAMAERECGRPLPTWTARMQAVIEGEIDWTDAETLMLAVGCIADDHGDWFERVPKMIDQLLADQCYPNTENPAAQELVRVGKEADARLANHNH